MCIQNSQLTAWVKLESIRVALKKHHPAFFLGYKLRACSHSGYYIHNNRLYENSALSSKYTRDWINARYLVWLFNF